MCPGPCGHRTQDPQVTVHWLLFPVHKAVWCGSLAAICFLLGLHIAVPKGTCRSADPPRSLTKANLCPPSSLNSLLSVLGYTQIPSLVVRELYTMPGLRLVLTAY